MRVWDFGNPTDVRQIGSYRTPRSLGTDDQGAGDYVIHDNLLVGTTLYESWYTDGVRVVDVRDPRNPREVAYFVPPATEKSGQAVATRRAHEHTQVWSIVVDEASGLVHASDMNSGLWILRRTG